MAALSEMGVVILAAGFSRRMGKPKLLLPWGGSSVLGHLLGQWKALGTRQIAVVCAAGDQKIEAELRRVGFEMENRIANPAPERGMFGSIQRAAEWSGWLEGLTHWAIVLGDQPHVRRQTLKALIDFSAAHPRKICQPSYTGRACHPVILPRFAFSLLASSDAGTLKEFRSRLPESIALCESNDAGLAFDIDSPEDYQRALNFEEDPS